MRKTAFIFRNPLSAESEEVRKGKNLKEISGTFFPKRRLPTICGSKIDKTATAIWDPKEGGRHYNLSRQQT